MDDLSWMLLAVQAIGMVGLLVVGLAGHPEREKSPHERGNDR
ncbi:MAG: hypothetical protein QM766_23970 [Burkholderiaceae bacterium]